MTNELFANDFVTQLVLPCGATDVEITVASAPSAPLQAAGEWRLLIDQELMIVPGGQSTNVLSVTRAAEGTTATTHVPGADVAQVLTAAALANTIANAVGTETTRAEGVEATISGVASGAASTAAAAGALATAVGASLTAEVTRAEAAEALLVPKTQRGTANGVATLDGTAQVPLDQLGNVSAGGSSLVPTAVKTANYTAAVSDFVPANTSGGAFAITLPTAPVDKAEIAIKLITAGNTLTITAGGSDVFNKAGGSTSLTLSLLNQGVLLQYAHASGIWYVLSDDVTLAALDARYIALGAAGVANGVATLDGGTKLTGSQLPSSVVNVSSGSPSAGQFAQFTGTGKAVVPVAAPSGGSAPGTKSLIEDYGAVGTWTGPNPDDRIADTHALQQAYIDVQRGLVRFLLQEAAGTIGFALDPAHFFAVSFTADLTSGSNVLHNVSDFSGVCVGAKLVGTGIPTGAVVQSFDYQNATISMFIAYGPYGYAGVADAIATATGVACTVTPTRLDISGQNDPQGINGATIQGLGNKGYTNSPSNIVWLGARQSGPAIFLHSVQGFAHLDIVVSTQNAAYDGPLVMVAGNSAIGDVQQLTWRGSFRALNGTPRCGMLVNKIINSEIQCASTYGFYDGIVVGGFDGVYGPSYCAVDINGESASYNLHNRSGVRINTNDGYQMGIRGASGENRANGQCGIVSCAPNSNMQGVCEIEGILSGDNGQQGGQTLDLGPCGDAGVYLLVGGTYGTPLGSSLGLATLTSGSNVVTAANGSFVAGPSGIWDDLAAFPVGTVIHSVTGSAGNQTLTMLLPIGEADMIAGSPDLTNVNVWPWFTDFDTDALFGCTLFDGTTQAIPDGTTILSTGGSNPFFTAVLSANALISAQAVTLYVQAKASVSGTNIAIHGGCHVRANKSNIVSVGNGYETNTDVLVYHSQQGASVRSVCDTFSAPDLMTLAKGPVEVDHVLSNIPGGAAIDGSVSVRATNLSDWLPSGDVAQRMAMAATAHVVGAGPIPLLLTDHVDSFDIPPLGGERKIEAGYIVGTATLGVALGTGTWGIQASEITAASGTFSIGQVITGLGLTTGTTITGVSGSTLSISPPTFAGAIGSAITQLSATATIVTGAFVAGQTLYGAQGDPTILPAGVQVASVSGSTLTLSYAVGAASTYTLYGLSTVFRAGPNGVSFGSVTGSAPPPSPVVPTIPLPAADSFSLDAAAALVARGLAQFSGAQGPSALDAAIIAWITAHGGAYWALGEVTGVTSSDTGGGSHNGTDNGGVILGQPGVGDVTLSKLFDGTGWVSIPESGSLEPTGAFTMLAFINPSTLAPSNQFVFANIDSTGGHGIALGLAGGSAGAFMRSAGHVGDSDAVSGVVTEGQFQMIAASFDGTSTLDLSLNAVSVATNTTAHAPDYTSAAPAIGQDGAAATNRFNGSLAKVALITGVALSIGNLATLFALAASDPGIDGGTS